MASTIDAASPAQRTHSRAAAPPRFSATDVLLLCMALIWGVNFAVVKYGTQAFSPLAFNGARISLAACVLVGIVVASGRSFPSRADALRLLALGALGNGLYQILFVEGIARTRAGDAALLISASPAFMAIIGRLRGTERTGALGAGGIALSLVGIALVVFGADAGSARDASLAGDALLLGASLCWSLYTVLLKPYTERIEGVTLSAVTMVGGVVPLVVVAAPELLRLSWSTVPAAGWGALAYSGLLALAVAYLFWYRGVRVLGPTRAGMYSNLQPIFALAFAWLTLHEAPRAMQLAGAVCILAGLLLTRIRASAAATPPCE